MENSLNHQHSGKNIGGVDHQGSRQAMQKLYKQQLDILLQEKNKQKEIQRNREIAQKKQFNERALNNKQSQKIKQQTYKNYYNMLLNNQEHLKSSYVSPYSVRDNMKDQHILHSVQQGQAKSKQWDIQQKRRLMQQKNMYRSQLMGQIEERKRMEIFNKQKQQRKKQQFRKYGKLPDQINKYERQKHMEQMSKYKEDLDKLKTDNYSFKQKTLSEQQNIKMPENHHHALINPLPYNIQNPYILREMNKQTYLATRGTQNLAVHPINES